MSLTFFERRPANKPLATNIAVFMNPQFCKQYQLTPVNGEADIIIGWAVLSWLTSLRTRND